MNLVSFVQMLGHLEVVLSEDQGCPRPPEHGVQAGVPAVVEDEAAVEGGHQVRLGVLHTALLQLLHNTAASHLLGLPAVGPVVAPDQLEAEAGPAPALEAEHTREAAAVNFRSHHHQRHPDNITDRL